MSGATVWGFFTVFVVCCCSASVRSLRGVLGPFFLAPFVSCGFRRSQFEVAAFLVLIFFFYERGARAWPWRRQSVRGVAGCAEAEGVCSACGDLSAETRLWAKEWSRGTNHWLNVSLRACAAALGCSRVHRSASVLHTLARFHPTSVFSRRATSPALHSWSRRVDLYAVRPAKSEKNCARGPL